MRTIELDTKPANCGWWAARDADRRSSENKQRWNSQVRLRVERIKLALELLYWGNIYEAYGRKQVSVKVDRARVKDAALLAEMEAYWDQQGVVKTVTAQGVLYRVA